jgi:hypothetical protein
MMGNEGVEDIGRVLLRWEREDIRVGSNVMLVQQKRSRRRLRPSGKGLRIHYDFS